MATLFNYPFLSVFLIKFDSTRNWEKFNKQTKISGESSGVTKVYESF